MLRSANLRVVEDEVKGSKEDRLGEVVGEWKGSGRSRAAIALALTAILIATLTPGPPSATAGWKTCFVCGDRGVADLLVNIILFVPLGVALAADGKGWVRICVLGVALSASVEFAQLFIPGRDSSLADVCTNALGALAGWGSVRVAARTASWLARPTITTSAAACAPAVMAIVATGLLLQPDYPATTYYGQWTPNLAHLEWYRGRVLAAFLGSVPLPAHDLQDSWRVRALLYQGAPLRVRALAGPPLQRLGSLFSIYDQAEREIVLIGPQRGEWVFRHRTRAAAWLLDQPDIRVTLSTPTVGDTLLLTIEPRGRGYCIGVAPTMTCGVGFTAGMGWGLLLYPHTWPAWLRAALGVAWMAGLWLSAGFYGGSRRLLPVVVIVLVAALALIAPAAGLVATNPAEWGGAVSGLLAGMAGRHRVLRGLGARR